MKLTTDACQTVVTIRARDHKPIRLRFAGLTLAMKPDEARALADALVDAAEQAEGKQP